jgi:hypothetical protein
MKILQYIARQGLALGLATSLSATLSAQTTTWIGGSTGSWHLGTNWSSGNEPIASDNVGVGTGGGLVYSTGNSPLLSSVSLARPLEISGGTLQIASALDLSAGGTLRMTGGTLKGATISNSSLVTFADANNVFDTVTLATDQPLTIGAINSTGRLIVKNGLSYNNGQVLNLGQYSKLYFDAVNSTLDNATINNLDNTYYTYLGVNGNNQALILGQNLILNATKYLSFNDQGYTGTILVNNTNLSSHQGGDWLLELKNIRNHSLIEASGAGSTVTFGPNALLDNQPSGEVRAVNGGGVTLYNATNLGKVRATDAGSIVNLAGNYTTADLSNAKSLNNGIVSLTKGTVNNTGATLNVSDVNSNNSGKFQLNGGGIVGGVIQNSEQLKFTNANNTLDNVTLASGQGLNIGEATSYLNPSKVVIKNGIHFSENPKITIGDNSSLYFDAPNSLLDNVTIQGLGFGVGIVGVNGDNQTLTIGPNLIINGHISFNDQGYIGTTLVNNGSLSGYISVKNLINNSFMGANSDGRALLLASDTLLDNRAGGEIRASNGGGVDLYNAINLGKIRATGTGSYVSLSGKYTTAQLTDVKSLNNGGIYLGGSSAVLDNTGATLNISDINSGNSGIFGLGGSGRIIGGTLQNSQQLVLLPYISGILERVTLAHGQGLNIGSTTRGGEVTIVDGINYSGNPTFNLGLDSKIWLVGSTDTLNNATFRDLGTNESTYIQRYGDLTLGSQLFIDPLNALFIGNDSNYGSLINNTTLSSKENSDLSNGALDIRFGSITNNNTINISSKSIGYINTYYSFVNNGIIKIDPESNLTIIDNYSPFSIDASRQMRQKSGHMIVNGVLNMQKESKGFLLQGGVLSGTGTIKGNIINEEAKINPGNNLENPVGTLTISNNYTQTVLGTLEIDIAGFNKGEFDTLYTHTANIDGLLKLNLSYTPIDGQEFSIIQTFENSSLNNENGVFGNFARIEVSDPNYTASFSQVNKQGVVKLNRNNSNNVPEPGTISLLLVGASAFVWRRHRARCA